MRRITYICISILISAGFVVLGVFVFSNSYLRVWEGVLDIGSSIKFYFFELFNVDHSTIPTVTGLTHIPNWDVDIPSDFEGFKESSVTFFELLVSKENFDYWLYMTGTKLESIAKISTIVLPCLVLLFIGIKKIYESGNTKHNRDTIPLRVFKKISEYTYQPLKRFAMGYVEFLKHNGWMWKVWLTMWVFHLNLASIFLEFIAYYLYFSVSFDFESIYIQVYKLIADLQCLFNFLPLWMYVVLGWLVFDYIRKRIAIRRLRHFENKNCGFINALPIVSITCGSMGKKKTTMLTDMALSQEVMFREKALEILQHTDMKFPYFPWIKFEDELRRCMDYGIVYNLATVKEWINTKRTRFISHLNADLQLYGYDYTRYGDTFNDNLKINELFEVLETYALAYFVYVIESSLIVSNYSIRTDNELMDLGNFPMWCMDFFPDNITEGRHAHILDFDALRLGRKVIENNPKIGSFEFGVVAISEVGKERGNNLELKEVKRKTDEANQKNDLFNAWLKMCRHSATIDNYPFIKVFTDEQRPESWGADARDLCDVINIAESSDQRLAMPFYTIEDMLAEWTYNKFLRLYYKLRFKRGDNTLLVHILKTITNWVWKRNLRIYNRYGYSVLRIEKERGTLEGNVEKKKYYLMNKKIYARRFSTDCFSDYFNELAKQTTIGINDYIEYENEKATVEELRMQNSYFINSLYGTNDGDGSAYG